MTGPGAIFARALRGIREHTWLFLMGVGVITTALFVLGLYGLVVNNMCTALGSWRTDVHVSAYYTPQSPAEARTQAQNSISARPEVDAVNYVDEAAAKAWMQERMPDLDAIVVELGDDVMPASLEITLKDAQPSAAELEAFAESIRAMGVFDTVDYGEDWVRRFQSFVSVVSALGITLGFIITIAAAVMVGNTIQLAVHARRDEVEIIRLVGGTDGYVLAPFLLEGALQGLLGAGLALVALYGVHTGLLMRVHEMFSVAFGGSAFSFLPMPWAAALLLIGTSLGLIAAFLAVRRFLGRIS